MSGLRRGWKSRGFTLVEMMAVMSILAVMAAIALPSFARQVKRTRASEAVMNLQRMWQAAVAYFQTEHTTPDGAILGAQFPSSSPVTPDATPRGGKYDPAATDWSHPTWDALNFSMNSAHHYQYVFVNRSDDDAPPGGGGAAFAADGPFASPGGPLGTGPFGGSDGKPGSVDKEPDGKAPTGSKGNKVTICHIPPGNPDNAHTLDVGRSSTRAHLAHGDYLGPCSGSEDEESEEEESADEGGGEEAGTGGGEEDGSGGSEEAGSGGGEEDGTGGGEEAGSGGGEEDGTGGGEEAGTGGGEEAGTGGGEEAGTGGGEEAGTGGGEEAGTGGGEEAGTGGGEEAGTGGGEEAGTGGGGEEAGTGGGGEEAGTGGGGEEAGTGGGGEEAGTGGGEEAGTGGGEEAGTGGGGEEAGTGGGGEEAGTGGGEEAGTGGSGSPDDEPPAPEGSDPFASGERPGPCQHLYRDGHPAPGFYVVATGNLDGDEDFGFYYRGATITPDCRIIGPPMVMQENPLE